ncbi:Delta3,5-Delta2,4-dienoyl-CoA isomerase, mitochondrial [Hondaea fermentalgiana]|uniref:Delta3,5-Delta2,4-dienoyl-CoA isomerase, mitochondrial n=1 Tax=Hondaea fermentalgiana TaxID=2315210 RepID=A0A2R5GNP0_9STRA|nr:Delta3,5-Delta2,4-dienoyl-CoA isomerase, mitochondrial [Hondaea fermentalgiana]|eukprot:GBG29484.1 Delta3,5-Delta2,4-dienoyl-CoA isomerase, mitochondrial [Hondaea fermentalgiana]
MTRVEDLKLTALQVHREGHVVTVELARPKVGNAMNAAFWKEYREVFQTLANDGECRAILVKGQGRFFSVGLDIKEPSVLGGDPKVTEKVEPAHRFFRTRREVMPMQETFTAMERCPQPVIACVHSAAIGGAIDLLTACDIRLCNEEAYFCIQEVNVGIAADVGTLQRLHHTIGNNSLARELAYTGRRMGAQEAFRAGFVSNVYPDTETLYKEGKALAELIASKSPIAVAGTKDNLNFSREHTVTDSLERVATWNAAAIQTREVIMAATAALKKDGPKPKFANL